MDLANVLVQGAVTSAVLALIALGFSVVYGVGGTVNLAHGSFYMLGAYGSIWFLFMVDGGASPGNWLLLVAMLAGLALAALGGLVVDQLVVRPVAGVIALAVALVTAAVANSAGISGGTSFVLGLALGAAAGAAAGLVVTRKAGGTEVTVLITTLATALLLQSLVAYSFGERNRGVPGLRSDSIDVLGVTVQTTRLIAFAVGVVVVVAAILLLNKTPVGRVVRAVAQDGEAATLMGIRTGVVSAGVMVAGAVLAGLAGVLVTPYQAASPIMWLQPLTLAFAVVILGGLGSVAGTLLAAVVIGYLDRAVAFLVPQGEVYAPLFTAAVILTVLVVRPQGLLGEAHP